MRIFEENFKIKVSALTKAEWKLRQQSTFMGFMWSLIHPALMFSVIYILFVKWLGSTQPSYAAFLLIGIVQWNYFGTATSMGMSALLRKSSILKNYKVSPETVVLSSVLSITISHLIEIAISVILIALFIHTPSVQWFLLLLIELCFLLFVAGTSLILAKLHALYNDMERIWTILLSAGFFLTPVFYPLSIIDEGRRFFMLFNPMTQILETTRGILIGQSQIGMNAIFYMLPIALGILVISLVFIRREKSAIMDNL